MGNSVVHSFEASFQADCRTFFFRAARDGEKLRLSLAEPGEGTAVIDLDRDTAIELGRFLTQYYPLFPK